MMKAEIEVAALKAAVSRCKPAVNKKSTMPILACVMLDVGSKSVTVTGNDMAMGIRATAECATEKPGVVCVSGERLGAVLDRLPDGTLQMESDGWNLKLRLGPNRFKLNGIDPQAFPSFPNAKASGQLVDLGMALSVVEHATGTDETRPALCGVHIGNGVVEATSGHRLAVVKVEGLEGNYIIPKAAIAPIRDMGVCDLSCDGNVIHATASGVTLSCRLIEGEYPDVAQIIRTEHAVSASCDPVSLADLILRTLVLNDRGSGVLLNIGNGTIQASAKSVDHGDASGSIDATTHGEIEIALNGQYLHQAIKALPPQSPVTLAFADELSPVFIYSSGAPTITLCIMPMRK